MAKPKCKNPNENGQKNVVENKKKLKKCKMQKTEEK